MLTVPNLEELGPDRDAMDAATVAEQIRLLMHARIDLPINLLNASIVTVILSPFYPVWIWMPWLSTFTIVILTRTLLRHLYRNRAPGPAGAGQWGQIFTLNAFATACLWGLTGSAILLTSNPVYHVFIVFVLGGMMAGGIVSNACYLPTMLAFMLPTVLPAIAILLSRPDIIQVAMGVMLGLFAAVLATTGWNINRSIVENFRLRIGQGFLLRRLQASEAAMAEAQAIAHVGSWDIDMTTRSETWSPETYRIFGVDPAVFKPSYETMLARVHPDDQTALSKDYAKILATGKSDGIDHRIMMDDGTIKHVRELGQATYDAGGRVVRAYGTVQDVTERKHIEATTAQLAAIVDSSNDAIVSENVDGKILSWNRGAEQMFGYRAEEMIGNCIQVIVPEELSDEIDRNLETLARGGPFDTERLRKDGTRIPVSIAISLNRDVTGKLLGASIVARDIRERRRAAAALAYRDRLLRVVTHGIGKMIKADSLVQGVPEALQILGETLLVDRVLVLEEPHDPTLPPALRYSWQMPGIRDPVDLSSFQPSAQDALALAAWRANMKEGKPVIAQMATSEGAVRAMLEHFRNQSTLLVPILADSRLWGNLGVDSCRAARDWSASEIDTLTIFGEIVGSLVGHSETRRLLERSEARFRGVTEAAQDAIITIDGAGRIGLWNAAAERILGYSAQEASGKQVHEFLAPQRFRAKADLGMEIFASTGQGDALGKTTRLAARCKDGTEITIELSLAGTRLDDHWEAIGILRDITERKNAEDALQFANTLLKSEMEASPYGIMVVDPNRKLLLSNQRLADIWKIPLADLIGINLDTALLKAKPLMADPESLISRANYLFNHPGEESLDEYSLTDGRIISRDIVTLSGSIGEYLGRVWYFRDITERRKAADKLTFANVLLKVQMEASPDGILIVDEDKRILSFNQRLLDIWQISQTDLATGEDEPVLATVIAAVTDPQGFAARVRYLYAHPAEVSHDDIETIDGRSIDRYSAPLLSPTGKHLGRAWFFRDITERKRVEALALRQARYDVLTGLANRAVFVEALQHAIAIAKRGGRSFAILYIDLDHFKDVNDTLGHPVGDELLKAVAHRLQANTRESDTVARFGGDEFAVIVADIPDAADAAIVADKLIKSFIIPFTVQNNEIHSGASIGIAVYGAEALDAETLLSHADVALYRAKFEGRGDYRFFTDAMDSEVQTRVALGAELRVAIDAGQLFLMFQPQVAIDSGRITGMEALVRWRHPQRGVLGPGIFIPIAEQIGIIAKLGHWVLWEACRQGRVWLDAGIAPVRISVNVSALQFKAPAGLEADIAAALAETGLPPEALELELTESVLMDAARENGEVLQRLRNTGITIAIDDFGTGYSSLDYLRRYPSNRIKIAQNFVTNLETTPGDAAIIRATIGLARELDINVIAEGVETRAQCDLLRSWGCGEVQGFHFSRPLTVDDATAALYIGEIVPTVTGLDAPGADSVARS